MKFTKTFNPYTGKICLTRINELTQELNNMEYTSKITSQETAINAIRGKYYMVGSVDSNGSLSFSANPAVHNEVTQARAECKRLAKMYPGKLFMFVTLQGAELVPSTTISI